MTEQQVSKAEGTPSPAAGRDSGYVIRPPVDIFEDAHGIMVVAEMPGVARERLNVHADRNNLTIEGDITLDMPQGMEAVHADVNSTRYSRSFSLSGELDTEAIDAKLKDGVLTVRIPKRREFRPRKVEVQVA